MLITSLENAELSLSSPLLKIGHCAADHMKTLWLALELALVVLATNKCGHKLLAFVPALFLTSISP